jgi:hypothetical protein
MVELPLFNRTFSLADIYDAVKIWNIQVFTQLKSRLSFRSIGFLIVHLITSNNRITSKSVNGAIYYLSFVYAASASYMG